MNSLCVREENKINEPLTAVCGVGTNLNTSVHMSEHGSVDRLYTGGMETLKLVYKKQTLMETKRRNMTSTPTSVWSMQQ